MSHGNTRLLRVLVLVLALVTAAALLISMSSCGSRTGSGGTSATKITGTSTGDATIDGYLEELDREINSVDPGDFDQKQLDNQELGL